MLNIKANPENNISWRMVDCVKEISEINGVIGSDPRIINKTPAKLKTKEHIDVKNWETSTVHRDTLHQRACPISKCSDVQCTGSIMIPSNLVVDPRTWNRSIEKTHQLAKDFIDQYFLSTKRSGSEAHLNRLKEVRLSIDETSTYELTEPELVFGTKLGWRNAPRCIGRIHWKKLFVNDFRHVTTTDEMFDALCQHVRYVIKSGNTRSGITIFPQRRSVKTEFRVWNSNLFGYAGYLLPDGKVVGDPTAVKLTQICQKLGWKGAGTPFDVLPLLLQANGEDPKVYEIPKDLALEVRIRHPQYQWMEAMGIKWHHFPSLSGMLLDIGGVQFPGCSFSGWYMETEVGRHLCDPFGYNLLKPIAVKMGLDVNNSSSLWKDKALVEINIAILHSFQSDHVAIMDHHVASEQFMKFFENEMKSRNGCPGDWVWLVPPLSGSTSPIFHQEMLNYILNPTFYYQPEPWKYYEWKNPTMKQNSKKHSITFKNLARSVRLISSMMMKAISKRIKATVLYATETGMSKAYAEQLKDIFSFAFNANVIAMDEYDFCKLECETLVLVVTSTHGNGDAPGIGEKFANDLLEKSRRNPLNTSKGARYDNLLNGHSTDCKKTFLDYQTDEMLAVTRGPLCNVKFSVFGLGSRAYPNFCAFAHSIDTLFGEMGAERLMEIGEGDEMSGQEESFRIWAKSVFAKACKNFCLEEVIGLDAAGDAFQTKSYDKENYRIQVLDDAQMTLDYFKDLENIHRKKLSRCRLEERIDLHQRDYNRATVLVKLKKDNRSELLFYPGDHIGIYPRNNPNIVKNLLGRIQDIQEESLRVQLQVLDEKNTELGGSKEWFPDNRLPPCSLWNAFSRYLDITTPPTPHLLGLLAKFAVNEDDKARLELLSKGGPYYDEWKYFKFPNMVEVLDEFSSIKVECSLLLSQLPLLQCRYYSISNSPCVYPDQIHCTLSVVSYHTQGGKGLLHQGVCSSFLDTINSNEDVICFIKEAHPFHLPDDPTTPCILIGPGTGIAPFRSFWQHRCEMLEESNVKKLGVMALLFGCRSHSEQLYKEEVEAAKKKGAISHYYTAYSRVSHKKKEYVQDIMENEISQFVFETLCKNVGHLYICGDVTMAQDVTNSVKKIVAKHGDMSSDEVDSWLENLRVDGRFHKDIFGFYLRAKESHHSVHGVERKQLAENIFQSS